MYHLHSAKGRLACFERSFCDSLIYNVAHYCVGKQRSNGRTHCYTVNLFVEFAIELESGASADPF